MTTSNVTSRRAMPVPPVVITAWTLRLVERAVHGLADARHVVGNDVPPQHLVAPALECADDLGPARVGVERAGVADGDDHARDDLGRARAVLVDGHGEIMRRLSPTAYSLRPSA